MKATCVVKERESESRRSWLGFKLPPDSDSSSGEPMGRVQIVAARSCQSLPWLPVPDDHRSHLSRNFAPGGLNDLER